MMNKVIITVIGIILFALATAVLYGLGLKKSMNQEDTLKELLYNNGAREVLTYLKKNDSVKKSEIRNIVKDIKASEFYSKKRAVVTDSNEFADALVDFMLVKKMIVKDKVGYRLP